jgi:hypothetical protein
MYVTLAGPILVDPPEKVFTCPSAVSVVNFWSDDILFSPLKLICGAEAPH